MKRLVKSSQFKKDFKKYKNQTTKLKKLFYILELLQQDINIPIEFKPHKLKGQYDGYLECHIENDFLLIWINQDLDLIRLERLGSHSELFK